MQRAKTRLNAAWSMKMRGRSSCRTIVTDPEQARNGRLLAPLQPTLEAPFEAAGLPGDPEVSADLTLDSPRVQDA